MTSIYGLIYNLTYNLIWSFYFGSLNNFNYISSTFSINRICTNIILLLLHINLIILLMPIGFFSKYFESKIAMKLANQTNKACRSNYSQKFDGVYSMSIVIIQPKLILNSRVVKYQKIKDSVWLIRCFA